MEEFQRKLNQRYEGTKPRKVRFKLASSYSGRVLKHVYEDGQELESPEEKYPHSFIHRKIPPSHLEMEQFCSFEETNRDEQGFYPTTGLIAQRINVYRGLRNYKPAGGQTVETEGDSKSSVLDFGKIIIYTSNLRIIRAPQRKPEMTRQHSVPPLDLEGCPKARDKESRKRAKALKAQEDVEKEENGIENKDTKVMMHGQVILNSVVRFLSPHFLVILFSVSLSLINSHFILGFQESYFKCLPTKCHQVYLSMSHSYLMTRILVVFHFSLFYPDLPAAITVNQLSHCYLSTVNR
ncbi:PREDICTED: glutaredoxin domain-containing cysteine-rich protein 2 isoform X1 [Poecilia mexicana]|uniref:uncharacterized protein LOC106906176 isoform X1 n=1 Tax=Poecilia mexicana TaxID=48701 RepID=UPI00072E48BD|nr:PREDICTED: uncharacterized protein LOC106906176 isoform X1 [Poecilia mexicana]XP_014866680.1 PREDICTED: glutaredoxin domain-containing cysteine-rich protein 2 isoform X1 [Poecilia mexicana]